jgi:DNA-binding NarL/FixJ family response regulator
MTNLRILVADDHEVVRRGLVSLIEAHKGWEVCGQAENGQMAVDRVKDLKPDVVILDITMPILDGLEATRQIMRDNSRVKVLILSMIDAERMVQAAKDAGACGYVVKSDAARLLVGAVQALEYNNTYFTARVAKMFQAGYLENPEAAKEWKAVVPSLARREQEVLRLLAEGQSTKKVADSLGIRPGTADTHRTNIMRKLRTHSVVGLILYAIRNSIVKVPAGADEVEERGQAAAQETAFGR